MDTNRIDEPCISFVDATKSFGSTRALAGVTFQVGYGETVALLGPNGAGKTTTIDLLLGLRTADSGSVEVLGGSAGEAVIRGEVGAMLQRGSLPAGATVAEVLAMTRRLYGSVRTQDELLELSGLVGLGARRVDRLSGGQA